MTSQAERIAEGWLTPLQPEVLVARARWPREPLLARIAADVRALFPGRVERLVLYGSRARDLQTGGHEARDEGFAEDSDWDIAVFLGDLTKADGKLLGGWAHLLWEETGWDVQARAFAERAYEERTMFTHNLRFDAVDL